MTVRQIAGDEWRHVSIADSIVDDCRVSNKTKERGYVFPLYLTPGEARSILGGNQELIPNLNTDIVDHLNEKAGNDLSPEEIFDYVYGVLHSKDYREKYKEFLKIDFPKVPYRKDAEQFRYFENIGRELRHLHLM